MCVSVWFVLAGDLGLSGRVEDLRWRGEGDFRSRIAGGSGLLQRGWDVCLRRKAGLGLVPCRGFMFAGYFVLRERVEDWRWRGEGDLGLVLLVVQGFCREHRMRVLGWGKRSRACIAGNIRILWRELWGSEESRGCALAWSWRFMALITGDSGHL